jgi:maleylpyruvate isomerase
VTNKARAHVWLFGGPERGEVRHLYPDGYDSDLAADAAASRAASELLDDLQDAFSLLEQAWDALDDALWDHESVMTAGRRRTMSEIVSHHLRDVEVHHVDLAIGYQTSDWPSVFVEGELRRRVDGLPDRADHADLLAWLLGRRDAPELGPW